MKEIIFSNKLLALQLLTEQIESQGIDIAPAYGEYVAVCFAIANDCGEAGREYFHRICRLYAHYSKEDVENMFNNSLAHGEKRNGLGSVFELAKSKGVNVKVVQERIRRAGGSVTCDSDELGHDDSKLSKISKISGLNSEVNCEEDSSGDSAVIDETIEGANPLKRLSTFPKYDWPGVINKVFCVAMNDQQRDALLLSSVSVLGTMLAPNLRAFYGNRFYNSLLHTFFVGPAASGKGVVDFTRWLADPLDKERLKEYEDAKKKYAIAKEQYRRQKGEEIIPEPIEPDPCMFISPGNVTSSSLMANIPACKGHCLIIETEADTINAANKSEFGNLHDIFRNAWDQAPLSMSRVTNKLLRKIDKYYLGLVICGTPKQFKTFIGSTENGAFSRFLSLYMSSGNEFFLQSSRDGIDGRLYFTSLGKEWFEVYKKICSMGMFTLVLTKEQEKSMHDVLLKLFKSAKSFSKEDLDSFVKRLPINLLRMMSTVAIIRAFEKCQVSLENESELYTKDLITESLSNRDDDEGDYFDLSITEHDFNAVLSLAPVLFEHALHTASLLESSSVKRTLSMEQMKLYDRLGNEFTTKEAEESFKEMFPDLSVKTVGTWLYRWCKGENRLVERLSHGRYVKLDSKNVA